MTVLYRKYLPRRCRINLVLGAHDLVSFRLLSMIDIGFIVLFYNQCSTVSTSLIRVAVLVPTGLLNTSTEYYKRRSTCDGHAHCYFE